jgi:hypothetical protein
MVLPNLNVIAPLALFVIAIQQTATSPVPKYKPSNPQPVVLTFFPSDNAACMGDSPGLHTFRKE